MVMFRNPWTFDDRDEDKDCAGTVARRGSLATPPKNDEKDPISSLGSPARLRFGEVACAPVQLTHEPSCLMISHDQPSLTVPNHHEYVSSYNLPSEHK